MCKCGWQGCGKAYGTLKHLNAYVTMQGPISTKRPPEGMAPPYWTPTALTFHPWTGADRLRIQRNLP